MAINNSCSSAQTFCNLGYQTINKIPDLNFTYSPNIIQNDTKIQAEIWNEIIKEIKKIYNYGIRGTRNPASPLGITTFKTIQDTHKGNETEDSAILDDTQNSYLQHLKISPNLIPKNEYDIILSTIGLTPPADINIIITEEQFTTIKNTINNLQLNTNRCDNCNSGCNTSCQVNCNSNCYTCPDCYSCGECYSKCEGVHCSSTYCINYM